MKIKNIIAKNYNHKHDDKAVVAEAGYIGGHNRDEPDYSGIDNVPERIKVKKGSRIMAIPPSALEQFKADGWTEVDQGMAEGSQRVDSIVTDALKIMRGSGLNDAVQALKTVLGDREYNDRRGHYNFYVRQLMDMYGQQGMAETLGELRPKLGSSRDQGKSVRKWRKDRGMDESGVAEGHTEIKDKEGKVVSWKDDSEWHPAEKNKQGQPKDPRGVVTHLSDVARRKTADQQGMDEGFVGNMVNKAKNMFTKPAAPPAAAPAPSAPAPVVPNAATQARITAAPQGYDPNTGKPQPQVAAKAAPGVAQAATGAVKPKTPFGPTPKTPEQLRQIQQAKQAAAKQAAATQASAPAAPAAAPAPSGSGGVQGIKSNVDVNTLQKFNGIVDVTPKIQPPPQVKDAKGRTWTKLPGGWTQDGTKREIDRQDSTYLAFDDAWRVANGAQPGNVGVPGAQQPVVEAEVDSDGYSMDHADSGEYDYEGDQARDQMNTIVRAARRLNGMLDDNENMPEWVQMKVTLAADYLDTAADYIESNQEPELEEGWKEKLGGAALAGAMALGAGGAQARVMPGDDPGINRLTGKPIATQQATDTAPTQSTSSISVAKPQAQYDVDTQTLTYKGKQYKWNSDAQATGQGEVVTAPSMAVGSRSMGSTKVELNPNGTYTKVPANESQEKVGDMDADKFDAAMARLKQLAGAGPLKTVYDPEKRVYRNVPSAVQPRK